MRARAVRAPIHAAAADPPCDADLAASVLDGLARPQKSLPSRFFYDTRGSALFEQITMLDEYYLTRTEIGLLERHAGDMAELIGAKASVIEFGSGSSRKIPILLEALEEPAAWVPIDIDQEMLAQSVRDTQARFPSLRLVPIHADFMQPVALPARQLSANRVGFFPGSTIGNFRPHEALGFLRRVGATLGRSAAMLIGVDRKKDLSTLLAAYDDAAGVTAAFNRNLLVRINRELGADFDLDGFAHEARYDIDHGRIEMHLVARTAQSVQLLGRTFRFAAGETIHTEVSCKYTMEEFRLLARAAGWRPVQSWTDPRDWFAIHFLRFCDDEEITPHAR
jgi:dimethylhistidine N-methyltransferase